MTLAELTISMMLGAIAMTLMGSIFVSALRHNRTVVGKTTSTADARIALEAMTRDLRVAVSPNDSTPALIIAGQRQVSFYSSKGTGTASAAPLPSKVEYTIDTTAHCLRRVVTPGVMSGATLTWPAAGAHNTCVARGDINLDGSAVFSYFPQITEATPSPAPFAFVSGQLPTANLSLVAGVSITLTNTDTANKSVKGTKLQDQVSLVNVIEQLNQAGN